MFVFERPFFSLAVVDAPLDELVAGLSSVPLRGVRPCVTPLVFPSQPYSAAAHDAPMLLWSPASEPNQTAFMPQVSSGDYFVVALATERLRYRAVAVRSTSQDVDWPINEFAEYSNGARRRFVRAMRDSPRWEFYTEGEPLAFEPQAAYAARRIRDRFQREALISYVEHWGAAVRSPKFWQSNGPAVTFARTEIPQAIVQ